MSYIRFGPDTDGDVQMRVLNVLEGLHVNVWLKSGEKFRIEITNGDSDSLGEPGIEGIRVDDEGEHLPDPTEPRGSYYVGYTLDQIHTVEVL